MSLFSRLLRFQCCFCAESIASSDTDPVVLRIELDDGSSQDLYCHAACLRMCVDPNIGLISDLD